MKPVHQLGSGFRRIRDGHASSSVVTNVGTDKSQLANMANQAKAALEAESLEAFADRGYFKGEEILACEDAGITVTLPKPSAAPKNLQLWITPYIWVDMEGESRPACRICGTVPPVEGSPDAFWTALDS